MIPTNIKQREIWEWSDHTPGKLASVLYGCLKTKIHYRTLVLSSLEMCRKRLSHRILSLESATHPEGASDE